MTSALNTSEWDYFPSLILPLDVHTLSHKGPKQTVLAPVSEPLEGLFLLPGTIIALPHLNSPMTSVLPASRACGPVLHP